MKNMDCRSNLSILKPKLTVLDLDHTLWPFRLDRTTTSPFSKNMVGAIIDDCGKQVECFPNVQNLLKKLVMEGHKLAVASRIKDICGAYQLLEFFGLSNLFEYKEIYHGPKIHHFQQLHEKSGVKYSEMLFFDDDKRNIRDISKLGAVTFQVPESGISEDVVEKGLEIYRLVHCL